jgi:hypothetical protein
MEAEEAAQFMGVKPDRFRQLAPPSPATSCSGWLVIPAQRAPRARQGRSGSNVGQRPLTTGRDSLQNGKRSAKEGCKAACFDDF